MDFPQAALKGPFPFARLFVSQASGSGAANDLTPMEVGR